MSNEVSISQVKTSDDSDLRSVKVKLSENYITTPLKAITTTDFYKDTDFPRQYSGISEHYMRFNDSNLLQYYSNQEITSNRAKEFIKHKRLAGQDKTSITLIQYLNQTPTDENGVAIPIIPSDDKIKALINAAYSLSDITAIPAIPRVARSLDMDLFEKLLQYIKKAYEEIEIRNKKKILGYIPLLPPLFCEELIDFYLRDLGINAFYVDFDATTLNTKLPQIDAIKRTLAKEGYEEKHFIHYVNISYGKAINDIGVLTARDLLTFAHGFDSLGGIHVAPRRPPEFYEWLKKKKDIKRNSTRALDIDDYGYYRCDIDGDDFLEHFPDSKIYSLDKIKGENRINTKKRIINIVNLEQQVLESRNLQTVVEEQNDKTIKYFESKKHVTNDDIKLIKESI